MRIGQQELSRESPVVFVSEVGGNHNGSVQQAIQLAISAIDAGAQAVKFQKRTPELSVPEHVRDQMRETPWGQMTYMKYRKRMEFNRSQYDALDTALRALGIPWFVSVWDVEAVRFMEAYDPLCYKIPSACTTDCELLSAVRRTGRPTIMSTGGASDADMAIADTQLSPMGRERVICQTTSSYPTQLSEVNLGYISTLAHLDGVIPGYSGHEIDIAPTVGAAVLGAKYIERHFTNDKAQWGSDHSISLLPEEFRLMVNLIREIEAAMGDGVKRVYASEQRAMDKLRRFPAKETAHART